MYYRSYMKKYKTIDLDFQGVKLVSPLDLKWRDTYIRAKLNWYKHTPYKGEIVVFESHGPYH